MGKFNASDKIIFENQKKENIYTGWPKK